MAVRYAIGRKRFISTMIVASVMFFLSVSFDYDVYAENPSHLDRFSIATTCSACHSAHGKRQTPGLRKTVPDLCFDCHGHGKGSATAGSSEIYDAFQKRYKHPVDDTALYHRADETLPVDDLSVQRHVSCLDCHNPHMSEHNDPFKGVSGYTPRGMKRRIAKQETEICYKCHSESAQSPFSSQNTMDQFDESNASYHPVENPAKRRSNSLVTPQSGKRITCSECHEPHGSDHRFMLRYHYRAEDGPETAHAYELCYTCHRRDSILGDQSFREHRKHIVFASISCGACHNAHGSRDNKSLIEFNISVASPNENGMLLYIKTGKQNSCFLSCHNVEHAGDAVERKSIIKELELKK